MAREGWCNELSPVQVKDFFGKLNLAPQLQGRGSSVTLTTLNNSLNENALKNSNSPQNYHHITYVSSSSYKYIKYFRISSNQIASLENCSCLLEQIPGSFVAVKISKSKKELTGGLKAELTSRRVSVSNICGILRYQTPNKNILDLYQWIL
jgi:hypothetical protein